MAKLIVQQGEDEGETFEFEPPIKFGRDEDNEFTVSDPRVSRIHGRVSRDGDDYYIEDLGSSNGTHVNGISTSRSQVVHGDLIQIGDTELIFKLDQVEPDQDPDPLGPDQEDELEDELTPEQQGEDTGEGSNALSTILAFIAVLILLIAIGYGSYYLFSTLL